MIYKKLPRLNLFSNVSLVSLLNLSRSSSPSTPRLGLAMTKRRLLLRARRLLRLLRLRRSLFLLRQQRSRCSFVLPRLQGIFRIHALIRRHRILLLLRLLSFLRSPPPTPASALSTSAGSSASSSSASSPAVTNASGQTEKDIIAMFCPRRNRAPCLECFKLGRRVTAMDGDDLKQHINRTHRGLRYPCRSCENKFKCKPEVKDHRQKHHGKGAGGGRGR